MSGPCIDTYIPHIALKKVACNDLNLIGRHKEMFQLINKLLSQNSAKIFTVWGQHGVGKTALV